jgi:hypothetical protein
LQLAQGLKPIFLAAASGTTEVVPFQSSIYATSSSLKRSTIFAAAVRLQEWMDEQ